MHSTDTTEKFDDSHIGYTEIIWLIVFKELRQIFLISKKPFLYKLKNKYC